MINAKIINYIGAISVAINVLILWGVNVFALFNANLDNGFGIFTIRIGLPFLLLYTYLD